MIDKNDISIILPLYEDVDSIKLLIKDIEMLPNFNYRIVIVDDGSRLHPPTQEDFSDSILTIEIVKLSDNFGHQVAITVGLKYVASSYPNSTVIVMDADGEDPAYAIPILLSCLNEEVSIVFNGRVRRHRSFVNKFLYLTFWCIAKILTGHSISVGNFSALSPCAVDKFLKLEHAPIHFASAIIASSLEYSIIKIERNNRYLSESKMHFIGLVSLAFRAMSVFKTKVIYRLTAITLTGLIISIYLLFFQYSSDTFLILPSNNFLLIVLYLQIPILILTIIFFGLMVLTLNNNKQIMEKIDVITSDSVLFKKD